MQVTLPLIYMLERIKRNGPGGWNTGMRARAAQSPLHRRLEREGLIKMDKSISKKGEELLAQYRCKSCNGGRYVQELGICNDCNGKGYKL